MVLLGSEGKPARPAAYRQMRKQRKGDSVQAEIAVAPVTADGALAQSTIVVELTAACNAKCPGCFPQYLDLPQGFSDTDLTRETITAFAQKGGKALTFTARGEPLLDKKIPEYVKYAKSSGIDYVEFTTNGQLLTEPVTKRLIDAGLDTIRFSMPVSRMTEAKPLPSMPAKAGVARKSSRLIRGRDVLVEIEAPASSVVKSPIR